jgi:phosphoglycolate phosphatase-like HAD superfamily hydrolase
VLAQSRYGTSDVRIVIRGYGARGAGDRSNAGTSRGVRVLVDGIPETEPDGRTAFDQIDLAAAEGVGADPGRCVAIEDSENGMRAAHAAGMTIVAVPNPHYPPDDGALSLAAATVEVPAEITPELVEAAAPG